MNKVVFILLFLPKILINAQQTSFHGVVSVFNSKFETGKPQYISNAAIEEALGRSHATLTLSDGSFNLPLVGVPLKASFDFTVKKENYEVINTDQLRAVAGQLEVKRIYMAPHGKIAENKRSYYKIGKTASERALHEKIAEKRRALEVLHHFGQENEKKIRELEKEIADLTQRYETIDQNARELAERFTHINLDDASELYQRAFLQFQNGFIDSALLILDEVNWEARVDSILGEEARLFALQQLIQHKDSAISLRRDSLAAAIWVITHSHFGLKHYREALRSGEKLIQLYFYDPILLADTYRKIAWLALAAQEFAVAKLYARQAQRIGVVLDPVSERYIAFACFFLGDEKAASEIIAAWQVQNTQITLALKELVELEQLDLSKKAIERLNDLLK